MNVATSQFTPIAPDVDVNTLEPGAYVVAAEPVYIAAYDITRDTFGVGPTREYIRIVMEHPPTEATIRERDGAFIVRKRLFEREPEYFETYELAIARADGMRKQDTIEV